MSWSKSSWMIHQAVQAVGSFFGGGNGQPVNHAHVFVSLKPKGFGKNKRHDDPATIINRLRPKLSKVAGAYLYLQRARISGRGDANRSRPTFMP